MANFIVYGPPCGGKTTFVKERIGDNDLVLDVDSIHSAITWKQDFERLGAARPFVFAVRQSILGLLERDGFEGKDVWVIASAPRREQRDLLVERLGGAELIPLIPTEAEAHERCRDAERPKAWHNFISEWFEEYEPEETRTSGQNKRVMENEVRHFEAQIETREINEETRTIELAFSSETPVERHFGSEVLDHSDGAVDLTRLNDGAPLLLEHDRTQQIGVIESARVDDDRVGRAKVRFSKSALGQEIFQDVKDGIRRLVSVGYVVGEFAKEKADAGLETLRAINWEPLEISVVSIPADSSVGVGRSENQKTKIESEQPKKIMEDHIEQREAQTDQPAAAVKSEVRVEVRPDKRANEIAELGRQYDASEVAVEFIAEGRSADDFKTHLIERNAAAEPIQVPAAQGDDEIGMSNRERKAYSLSNAITSSANGGLTGIELEASRELEKRFGKPAQGFYVPNDVFTRDLTATDSDTGDKLVAQDHAEMIDALKAQPLVQQLGARMLSGLTSNITIPKSGEGTAYWTAENAAATESTQTIGSISLSPKRVAAYSELSKQLLAQSNYDVEGMIRDDLIQKLNLAFDKVAIDGGGSNEPSGVLDNGDINEETGGQTWANMVDAEGKVLTSHALAGSLSYVSTPAVMATLKATDKGTDTGQFVWADGKINGFSAVATTQMTADITVFGDWSQVILAEFGAGVDLVVDPYSLALTGMLRVHVSRLVDVGVRQGAAFCKVTA